MPCARSSLPSLRQRASRKCPVPPRAEVKKTRPPSADQTGASVSRGVERKPGRRRPDEVEERDVRVFHGGKAPPTSRRPVASRFGPLKALSSGGPIVASCVPCGIEPNELPSLRRNTLLRYAITRHPRRSRPCGRTEVTSPRHRRSRIGLVDRSPPHQPRHRQRVVTEEQQMAR